MVTLRRLPHAPFPTKTDDIHFRRPPLMRSMILAGPAFAVLLATLTIPAQAAPDAASPADVKALIAPWTGPYGGEPPFDKVKVAAFEPALREAMREQLAEIDKIAGSKAPPSFDNTIAALERAG